MDLKTVFRVIFIFLFSFSAVFAQQTEQSNEEVQEVFEPFDVVHLSSSVERTDAIFRYCRGIVQDTGAVMDLNAELESIVDRYNPDRQDSLELDYEDLNLWDLKEKLAFWEEIKLDLQEYIEGVREYGDEIRSSNDSLRKFNRRWIVTKEITDTLEDNEGVSETVLNTINTSKELLEKLKKMQSAVLELENKASNQTLVTNDVLQDLQDLIEERGLNIFSRDSKHLIGAWKADKSNQNLSVAIVKSFVDAGDEIGRFVQKNQSAIFYHLAFFLLLIVILVFTNSRFKKSDLFSDENFEIAKGVLGMPVASALVLSIIFSSWFYGVLPVLVRDALIVVTLLPLVLLLPKVVGLRLHFFSLFLVLIVILDRIQELLPMGHINQRLLVLILGIIVLAGFIAALVSKSDFNRAIKKTGNPLFFRLIQFYIAIICVALMANLAGVFGLARLLTSGVVFSFLIGVLVFVSLSIVKIVILYIVRSGLSGKLNILKKYSEQVEKWTYTILKIYAIWIWFLSVLRGFSLRVYVEDRVDEFISLSWQFGEINLSISSVLNFLLILAIFIVIANAINIILREEILKRFDVRKGVTLAFTVLSRYIIVMLGFVLAMSSAGISLSKLSILIGALGVGIGFGLQSIVSNIVSGLVIIFERPIHIGDIVTTGTIEGEVIDIGLRSSRIRNWEGAEVMVPNNNLISTEVVNWTFSDSRRRIERIVLIDSGPNPRDVKKVIDNVISDHKGLLDDPKPMCYFLGFENNALKFRLLIWMNDNILKTPSEVLLNLYDALEANGYKAYLPVQKIILEDRKTKKKAQKIIGNIIDDEKPGEVEK